MQALTLIRPWPWAITRLGKWIENRSWPPPHAILGEQLAIHAGLAWDADAARHLEVGPEAQAHPPMAVVAVCRVRAAVHVHDGKIVRVLRAPPYDPIFGDAHKAAGSPWWQGPWGWLIEDVRELATPVPCPGRQRLWRLPAAVEAAVREQL